jgi:hypothetical protein
MSSLAWLGVGVVVVALVVSAWGFLTGCAKLSDDQECECCHKEV